MGNEEQSRGLSVGVTSMVVIFVVLTLTVFAVLSLSTALNEQRLTDKYADSAAAYWQADQQASALANQLGALWQAGAEQEQLAAVIADFDGQCRQADGALLVQYTCPIDQRRGISVGLRLDGEFTITAWQTVLADGAWQAEDTLPVWQGD